MTALDVTYILLYYIQYSSWQASHGVIYIYYCSYHRIVLHFFFAKFYKGLRICLFIVFRNVERWDPFIFAKCYKGLRNCMFIVFGIVGRWDPNSRFLSFLLQSIALAASAGRVSLSLRWTMVDVTS